MTRIRKPQPQNFNPPKKCGGKYCYPTKLDAELVVEEKSITNPEVDLDIYHCHSCHSWHLTSKKPS